MKTLISCETCAVLTFSSLFNGNQHVTEILTFKTNPFSKGLLPKEVNWKSQKLFPFVEMAGKKGVPQHLNVLFLAVSIIMDVNYYDE